MENPKKQLRPEILSIIKTENFSALEKFQNEILRPIIKLQHDLILTRFEHYLKQNKINIIDSYKAYKVNVPKNMMPWMRSNHAGETGAVWIYIGARCVFWNKSIRDMSTDHYKTEKNHLIVMKYLVPKMKRSKLLILWRILGFFIGLISALLGFRGI